MTSGASSRILALVLIPTALVIAQQTGGSGSSGGASGGGTGGASSGGGGSVSSRPTTTTTPTSPLPNSTPSPGLESQRPIFLSGRVLLQDGSTPPERAAIERVCGASTIREAYTDSRGYFSFQVGQNAGIFGDASTDTGDFLPGRMGTPITATAVGNPNQSPSITQLWGCELRASLAGYHSDSISLATRRSMDNPEVGVIYLQRMLKVDGYTTSATLALAPKDARKAYERGLNFVKKSKPDEAQAEFQRAVEIYPKLAAGWFELGKVYEQRNHLDEAREAYLKATKADGNFVNPYERLYMMALHDTDWKSAAELTDKVLHLNPYEFSGAYYANAIANAQLHNWDAAEKSAREASQIRGTRANPKSLYVLGMILANKGDLNGSVESLRSYLKTNPEAADRDRTEKMLAQIQQDLQAGAKPPAAPPQ